MLFNLFKKKGLNALSFKELKEFSENYNISFNQFLENIGEEPSSLNRYRLKNILEKNNLYSFKPSIIFFKYTYLKESSTLEKFSKEELYFQNFLLKRVINDEFEYSSNREILFDSVIDKFRLMTLIFQYNNKNITEKDKIIFKEFVIKFLEILYSNGTLFLDYNQSSTPEYNFALRTGLEYPIYTNLNYLNNFDLFGGLDYLVLILEDFNDVYIVDKYIEFINNEEIKMNLISYFKKRNDINERIKSLANQKFPL